MDSMSNHGILEAFAKADPDSLSSDARYLLGCLDHSAKFLLWRAPQNLPSWRALRNVRRMYRDLGRDEAVVAAVTRLLDSKTDEVRSEALVALALYGRPVDRGALAAGIPDAASRSMMFAILGDTTAVQGAIEAYPTSTSRAGILDALYYLGSAAANAFIAEVAGSDDEPAAVRARWMLAHPMPVAAAQKL